MESLCNKRKKKEEMNSTNQVFDPLNQVWSPLNHVLDPLKWVWNPLNQVLNPIKRVWNPDSWFWVVEQTISKYFKTSPFPSFLSLVFPNISFISPTSSMSRMEGDGSGQDTQVEMWKVKKLIKSLQVLFLFLFWFVFFQLLPQILQFFVL